MRDLDLEAAIWYLFTSDDFYRAAANECDEIVEWFGGLTIAKGVAEFGRNAQIFEKFKKRSDDFNRGADLARLGDYKLVWDVAGSIRGDVRGILDQSLHGWMTEAEYREFDEIKISRLLAYARMIENALNNAMVTDNDFFNPDPNCPGRNHDDDGFPGSDIVERYEDYVSWELGPVSVKIPAVKPKFVVDRSVICHTGEEVPWTGVWHPSNGLENYSLTFAVKGLRMQPAFRILKTREELEVEGLPSFNPQTVAVATTWHPVILRARQEESQDELRTKAGQPCPKPGVWQQVDANAGQRRYQLGETMANLGSAYGFTVWRWISD